jgi:homoserine dehydrogenase
MEDKTMKFAIMGYGVVGSGVAEVFYKNKESIEKRAGVALDLKYILDLRDLSDTVYANKAIKDFQIVLDDPEVNVVVETIGGLRPAYDFSMRCLQAGKHVITSNKELVATYGAGLIKTAKENNVNYLFEASVGGGIPIIHPLYQCLDAGQIFEIGGILNGTTNFIMTRMFVDGMSFEEALKLAQKNGYAEANPTADVEGHDACRKICILASLAFGKHVYPDEVYTEGITSITKSDILAASEAGYVIKLIGRVKKLDSKKLMAMVTPALISKTSQLANVSDVFNGIMVRGEDTGDVVFYGRGAGKLPTASAVLSDVVDAVSAEGHIDTLDWEDSNHDTVSNYLCDITPMMVRIKGGLDYSAFGDIVPLKGMNGETAFITHPISGQQATEMRDEAIKNGCEVLSMIRVLNY